MTSLFFRPWIGEKYGIENSVFKQRVLVLGGSHYADGVDAGESPLLTEDDRDATLDAVNFYLEGHPGRWKKTYSTFINSVFNRNASDEEKARFFDEIVFCNYVQEFAGDHGSKAGDYDYSKEQNYLAFLEILEKAQPDVVISWGNKVWDALPNDWGFGEAAKGKGVEIDGADFFSYYDYPYRDRRILLVGVHHPSSGYASQFHHSVFRALNLLSADPEEN